MLTDLRQAVRFLLKSPGFTALVVLVLALGIGANTAIFSIVNGVLLKPLPFADASRIVALQSRRSGDDAGNASYPDFADWRSQSTTIDRAAAYATSALTLTGAGEAVGLQAVAVTGDFFPLLGVAPRLGRGLAPQDDVKGAASVAVISETAWEQHFARDPSIVGRAVTLDGQSVTVVGVMPASFQFPIQADRMDVWVPVASLPFFAAFGEQRGAHFLQAIGHVKRGATIEQAQAELTAIAARLAADNPRSNASRTVRVKPLQDTLVADYRLGLVVLIGAVAAVLMIACANVANLLLARGVGRQREMAIRTALGAGRGRLVRQLLTESLLLSVLAGAAGLLLGLWGVPALISASPVDIPRLRDVHIDRAVLAFTTLISMATGVLFGLAPAMHLARSDANEALKEGGRGSGGAGSARTRQLLVIAEVALSLLLLASAGLLLRTLLQLQHVNPGFTVERAVTMQLLLPDSRYPDEAAQVAFYHRLNDELRTIPGIASSGLATTLPLTGSDLGVGFSIDDRPAANPGERTAAVFFAVSPDYFTAMGIPLRKGRTFTNRDREQAPNVAIISETMARHYWPGEDPIGKRLTIGYNKSGPREIIGVVGDVKQTQLSEEPRPQMYTPYPQTPWPFLVVVLRAQTDPATLAGAMRAAVIRLDPNQPAGDVKTIEEYVAKSIAAPRFTALLIGSFAGLALVLAGFGLYGVMAFSVAQRRREIGIRMALGAQPSDVGRLVLRQAVWLGAIGLGLGLVSALAATRVLGSLLFNVRANDPLTFASVSALLAAVVLLAAYLPARRATRVDPMAALRAE